MKAFLLRIGFWFTITTRLYYTWSKVYRFLFEQGYKKLPLTKYDTLADLTGALGSLKWVADGPLQLWDAISLPQKTEFLLIKQRPARSGYDCDEFSVYAVDRVEDMISRGILAATDTRLVQIIWLDSEGKSHGHNVCAFFLPDKNEWVHMSNWYRGRPQYGHPTFEDLIDSIVRDGTLIGWAACTSKLKLVKKAI